MSFETFAQQMVYDALFSNEEGFVIQNGVWVDSGAWDDGATWWSWGQVSAVVYDDVPYMPEGMPREYFPYIVIGDDSSNAWDTDDTLGAEVDITIDIWSRQAGFKETKRLMGEVYDVLNRLKVVKDGYNVVDCLYQFSEALRDPDGETRHGVMRFKLTVQKEN